MPSARNLVIPISVRVVPVMTLLLLLISYPTPTLLHAAASTTGTPPLMLANRYHSDIDITAYWVSEKLDGVRAYWDGHQLISRQGNKYHAPKWFIADFPATPLDGELWMGRGQFDALSAAVRKTVALDSEWETIRFMVFDLPNADGDFDNRLIKLSHIINEQASPFLALVKQRKFSSHTTLQQHFDEIIALGGEGLMLHLGSSTYRSTRSDDLLKLKRYQDAEATVLAHLPGKGKYQGMLGSLLVETQDGRRFKIGSGFTDAQRRSPPAIGSIITYKYYGLTNKGTPRFASFLRLRMMNSQ
ncbi:DNA ligase [Zhongshania aliphaticivorans]|uniref:DNA ligase n=1 Tax=Zhongshania aliphaticivorans TaxID=1470434 RepID=A0A5S9Q581_9GAMM|nr:DNA ligase [Zhongshania aliphaticivorans]CAA0094986.1 DNA ligase [Zhongshania aliphaticivorans]CAA0112788.1 DNA ligase [Zhongshania aliphaticivorans]